MTCITKNEDGAEILLDYSVGKLNQAQIIQLESHIQSCEECRHLVEAQKFAFEALDDFRAPEVSANFDRKLYARITEEKQSFWARWWKPVVPIGLAAAALSFALLMRTPDPMDSAPKQTKIEKADIDHLEQTLDDIDMLTPSSAM
jgi:anti-sigma factor RsiW